jgi:hypothetical protein
VGAALEGGPVAVLDPVGKLVDAEQPPITDFRHENPDNSDVIMTKGRDMNFQPAR